MWKLNNKSMWKLDQEIDNLKYYIRDRGYTLVSFADKYHIDRDKLKALVYEYDNQETFDQVLNALGMSKEELMCYTPREEAKISTVIKLDNLTENQYELIFKILDLANIAYTEERSNECNG